MSYQATNSVKPTTLKLNSPGLIHEECNVNSLQLERKFENFGNELFEKDCEASTDHSPMGLLSPLTVENGSTFTASPVSAISNLLKEVRLSNFFAEEFQKKRENGVTTPSVVAGLMNFKNSERQNSKFLKFFNRGKSENNSENISGNTSENAASSQTDSSVLSESQKGKFKFSALLKNNWKNKVETFKESRKTKLISKINFMMNSKINHFDLSVSEFEAYTKSHTKPKIGSSKTAKSSKKLNGQNGHMNVNSQICDIIVNVSDTSKNKCQFVKGSNNFNSNNYVYNFNKGNCNKKNNESTSFNGQVSSGLFRNSNVRQQVNITDSLFS